MRCVFCSIDKKDIVLENELALAFFDRFPVGKGHILIIPKRHAETYFDLTSEEKNKMESLLTRCKDILEQVYSPDGYNIGANCGETAGQTIFHCHIHLIPRYKGDMDNPQGGVRGVIPEKRIY